MNWKSKDNVYLTKQFNFLICNKSIYLIQYEQERVSQGLILFRVMSRLLFLGVCVYR